MATATGNYVHDNSSLANFQNWTTPIYNAFVTTCGWLQTADTGQAAHPIASVPSSAYAYWIFKANDAAAATQPIYVKVELGFSSTVVRIRMTVGTGSDGSGNITGGVSSSPWQCTSLETNNGATTYPCYFSGDGGNFRMYMWQTTSVAIGVVFGIARSVDSSGSYTTDYFSACTFPTATGGGAKFQSLAASGNGPYLSATQAWPANGINATTANTGASTASFAVFPFLSKIGNPMLDFVTFRSTDVADGATVTVSQEYGGTHTYIASSISTAITFAFGGSAACGMRYE